MRPICELVFGVISKQSSADQYHLQWVKWPEWTAEQAKWTTAEWMTAEQAEWTTEEEQQSKQRSMRGGGGQILRQAILHISAQPTSSVC